jgi:translation elongation factor EF-4
MTDRSQTTVRDPADLGPQNNMDERVTAPSRDEIVVPRDWLQAVVKLLDVMAGEGIGMEDCEDPADLAITLADHFGVGDFDDCLPALVERIANHGR